MKFIKSFYLTAFIGSMLLMAGCDKTKPYDLDVPPPAVHFVGNETQRVNVLDNTVPPYFVKIGTTDVANVDREVTVNISSPSGAVAGTDYTVIGGQTVVIKAGETIDSIGIQPNFSSYAMGEKDTLIISLLEPSLKVTSFQDTVNLILAGPSGCDESIVNVADLLGDYANTIEQIGTGAPYGPYTTSISSAVQTSPTTARIVVENLYDDGWGGVTVDLDWTDPMNRKATAVSNPAIANTDAGSLNPTYAGSPIAIRNAPASLSPVPGTYSYCDQTLSLKLQLGVGGPGGTVQGYFGVLYSVNMAR